MSSTFESIYLFFYGSLMHPTLLQTITGIPTPPITYSASITGWKIKIWGVYPTLVPSTSGRVLGVVWQCTSQEQFDRLEQYESSKYRWVECEAVLEGGDREEKKEVVKCRTFCWAGEEESEDLEEGEWDLKSGGEILETGF